MKRLINIILASLGTILLLGISQFSPVSALQEHSKMLTHGQGKSMSYEQHCSPSCLSTQVKKEDLLREINKKNNEDDEPQPPYYLQFSRLPIDSFAVQPSRPSNPEVSSKIPLYRLYGVVRR